MEKSLETMSFTTSCAIASGGSVGHLGGNVNGGIAILRDVVLDGANVTAWTVARLLQRANLVTLSVQQCDRVAVKAMRGFLKLRAILEEMTDEASEPDSETSNPPTRTEDEGPPMVNFIGHARIVFPNILSTYPSVYAGSCAGFVDLDDPKLHKLAARRTGHAKRNNPLETPPPLRVLFFCDECMRERACVGYGVYEDSTAELEWDPEDVDQRSCKRCSKRCRYCEACWKKAAGLKCGKSHK
ncbi:hypothetical protein M427DRAFT_57904 [Gonapodya prolifera JEL478]|uniref:Uncharacterized protein n=1 Tax=Gonapodya prolifera (strain JEL478) TaxID=1344416 RepID=A0A139ACJ1_GONPJ|nr:hypothetical protein M427DRAFT_57904 [Gonapodya prolifera JEL478]|eukprot:KXS14133.1 hypothetical protein M427DRAFT_57904 [Gonapodya prolifera JEL478]